MTDLLSLAARVEAATGPDVFLDVAIFQAATDKSGAIDYYTASLDAAMTLIPAQYRLGTLLEFDGEQRWAAKLFNRGKPGGLPAAGAANPALALTAACLRALAAQHEGEGEV